MKSGALMLGGLLAGVIGGSVTLSSSRKPSMRVAPVAVEGHAEAGLAALGSATTWLNSPPLTANALRGKVVLVDFLTYTCINWLRTLPHVRAWAEKYRDQGLVVIGVHSPEFEFEKDLGNVRGIVGAMNVGYPVAVDNEHAIWRAFDNSYWPALYFVDGEGRVLHHQFGEGGYDQAEKWIQQMLADAGNRNVPQGLVAIDGKGIEAAAEWSSLRSSENYVGYERTANFMSPGGAVPEARHVYTVPARLALNEWALSGDWSMGRQAITANSVGGRLVYRFHARDLHLVMGPASRGATVRFRVRIDGHAPGAAHGADVDADGNGTLTGQRLYQLIRQQGDIADRQFEIEFLDAGAQAFSFTFG